MLALVLLAFGACGYLLTPIGPPQQAALPSSQRTRGAAALRRGAYALRSAPLRGAATAHAQETARSPDRGPQRTGIHAVAALGGSVLVASLAVAGQTSACDDKQKAWLKLDVEDAKKAWMKLDAWRAAAEPVSAIPTEMTQPHSGEESKSAWTSGIDSSRVENVVLVAPAKMSEGEVSRAFLAKLDDMTRKTAESDMGDEAACENLLREDVAKNELMAQLDLVAGTVVVPAQVAVAIEQDRAEDARRMHALERVLQRRTDEASAASRELERLKLEIALQKAKVNDLAKERDEVIAVQKAKVNHLTKERDGLTQRLTGTQLRLAAAIAGRHLLCI